jgi:PHD/YefM family antitoxin component YafN of YafNO toxin-antitoxin module
MSNLQKIVDLIKKTGDKAIILNENGDPDYVLMAVGDYEDLVFGKAEVRGLTEQELLDKINRDIAIWKTDQEVNDLAIDQYDFAREIGDYTEFGHKNANFSEDLDNDRYYLEPVE